MASALLKLFYIHSEYIYEENTGASVLVREGDRFTIACNGTYMSTLVEGNHMRTPVIGGIAATAGT